MLGKRIKTVGLCTVVLYSCKNRCRGKRNVFLFGRHSQKSLRSKNTDGFWKNKPVRTGWGSTLETLRGNTDSSFVFTMQVYKIITKAASSNQAALGHVAL